MSDDRFDFKPEQWNFLAVLAALEGAVSVDIAAAVSPISPGSLIDVVKRAEELGLLSTDAAGCYRISSNLPDEVAAKLQRGDKKKRLNALLEKIETLNLQNDLPRDVYSNLLVRTGKKGMGEVEAELARQALGDRRVEKAGEHYLKALTVLGKGPGHPKLDGLFVDCTLEFSDLCFGLGRNLKQANDHLEQAKGISIRNGDKRSATLIDLHLGRILYLEERQNEAVEMMAAGEAGVHELDDDDIRIRSAEFLALYYFMQGRFSTAMDYFEQAYRKFESQKAGQIANLSVPVFYGYCAAFLGQFHKAIGCLDSAWQRARRESNLAFTPAIRAALGTVLILVNRKKEAAVHLKAAWEETAAYANMLGTHLAGCGIALMHFNEGNVNEAHRYLSSALPDSDGFSIDSYFSLPWILEMLFEFYRLGLPELPNAKRDTPIKDYIGVPSIHLRGVLWRLVGSYVMEIGSQRKAARECLLEDELFLGLPGDPASLAGRNVKSACFRLSEAYLKLSGDPIQLAKTRIEMARLELEANRTDEARRLAQKARKGLSGFWEDYFPDGIRFLLEEETPTSEPESSPTASITQIIDITAEFSGSLHLDTVLESLVPAMNRFLGAERGAVFWIADGKGKSLELRAGRNLIRNETTAAHFRPHMQLILDCFKKGRPLLLRSGDSKKKLSKYGVVALLCIPLKQDGNVCGVLYHDNSYLSGRLEFLNDVVLDQLATYLNAFIDRISRIEQLIDEMKESIWEETWGGKEDGDHAILAGSEKMRTILGLADKVARTDTTVLIQGETGVGKDLLARRIHRLSLRNKKPFVVIDPTTIPENLVESELFGHEKGAFTGADRQKLGRIELAHQGTLFIDEIGEIPKTIQAKLLRILQEKTFTRIGGNQTLTSDFRLVAATNRNLSTEMDRGRFRRDLFYRLNTIPVTLPPLRERNGDIVLLARHFLDQFAKKHLQARIRFRPEEERALLDYHWPGNVRELKSVIERAVILSTDGRLDLKPSLDSRADENHSFADTPSFEELQRRYFSHVLKKAEGKIGGTGGAAELTGLNRTTLNSRLKKLNLR
ncbi:MAG: GAF domain-containing protein [Proteobacteria bacterium]|nr:GAF domain-containing protein [Pseudomonadota bacterium]